MGSGLCRAAPPAPAQVHASLRLLTPHHPLHDRSPVTFREMVAAGSVYLTMRIAIISAALAALVGMATASDFLAESELTHDGKPVDAAFLAELQKKDGPFINSDHEHMRKLREAEAAKPRGSERRMTQAQKDHYQNRRRRLDSWQHTTSTSTLSSSMSDYINDGLHL